MDHEADYPAAEGTPTATPHVGGSVQNSQTPMTPPPPAPPPAPQLPSASATPRLPHHAIGPRMVEQGMQTTNSPHYAIHAGDIAGFPVAMMLWAPIILMFQGYAYCVYWRPRYLKRQQFMPDGTPTLLTLYTMAMFCSLLVGGVVIMPLFFKCAFGQLMRWNRDKLIIQTTALYVLTCSAPLMIIQQLLLDAHDFKNYDGESDPLRVAAKFSAHSALATALGCVWYLYTVYMADAMNRRARDSADEFLRNYSPQRTSMYRLPPTRSMYIRSAEELQFRQAHNVPVVREQMNMGSPTPTRVPLMNAGVGGGEITPPPE